MAARDRFAAYAEPGLSPLQRAIRELNPSSLIVEIYKERLSDTRSFLGNACDPQNYEPNLALNLEVTDLINSKKGNA